MVTYTSPNTNNDVFKSTFYNQSLVLPLDKKIDELELAKILNFTDEEIEMVKVFWQNTFNDSWLYLSDNIILSSLTNASSKYAIKDFYKGHLLSKSYEIGVDYIEVSFEHELVQKYYTNQSLEKSKWEIFPTKNSREKPSINKKFYIVTGSTYKMLLMASKTEKGDQIRKYYVKVEKLASIMKDFILHHLMFQNKVIENKNKAIEYEKKVIEDKHEKLILYHSKFLKRKRRTLYEIGNVVYIISHMSFDGNLFKFGKSTQKSHTTIPAFTKRLSNYNTGASTNYTVNYLIYIEDNSFVETAIKKRFQEYLNPSNKEWLKDVKLSEIVDFIRMFCEIVKIQYKEAIYIDNNLIQYELKECENKPNEIKNDLEEEIYKNEVQELESNFEEELINIKQSKNEGDIRNKDLIFDIKLEITDEEVMFNEDIEKEGLENEEISKEILLRKSIILSRDTKRDELQAMCRKYNLDKKGLTQKELYNRIKWYKETGEKTEYKTLEELRNECKEEGIYYNNVNKDVLESNLRHFKKTGQIVEIVPEDIEEPVGEIITINTDIDMEEKANILANLNQKSYDESIAICRKYKLIQKGSTSELHERIKLYIETGINNSQRNGFHLYDKDGKHIKHYKTNQKALHELDICANVIADAIDKNKMVNYLIFRSYKVEFKPEDLDEISKNNKSYKKQLTTEDWIEIKKLFDSGNQTKEQLMKTYQISKTQVNRIVKKTK